MIFVNTDYNRSNNIVHKLFLLLFYFQLILALMPIWRGSFLLKFLSYDTLMQIWTLGGLFSSIGISFFIAIIQRKVYNPLIFYCIIILYYFLFLSITINGLQSGLLLLTGMPVSYIALYDTLRQYKFSTKHLRLAYTALLIWSILPIIYFLISPPSIKILFVTGENGSILTFGGFAAHRNFYGILLGIAVIITILINIKKIYKIIIFIPLCIGLMLSECRTAIISIFGTLIYIFLFNKNIRLKKKLFFITIMIILICIIYYIITYANILTRDVSNNEDRIELWLGFIDIIKENIFFGLGKEAMYYSKGFPEGAQAHNFILATISSYGLFSFLSFILFLFCVFQYSNFYFKSFLVYLILWGITQPYFGCSLISVHIFIPLFFGHLLDNYKESQINQLDNYN
ncbi:O-antigen ligase family protein [Bacteroides caecigallinarum]|nr:O-antigen ligase family protein [Bacteroides caecigallinarum]